jgi:hypothetical protein
MLKLKHVQEHITNNKLERATSLSGSKVEEKRLEAKSDRNGLGCQRRGREPLAKASERKRRKGFIRSSAYGKTA